MTVWELIHLVVDWDNDDDRGIITRVNSGLYASHNGAMKAFKDIKKGVHIGYPEDYIEQTVKDNFIYLEENYRVELLAVIEQDVEE